MQGPLFKAYLNGNSRALMLFEGSRVSLLAADHGDKVSTVALWVDQLWARHTAWEGHMAWMSVPRG